MIGRKAPLFLEDLELHLQALHAAIEGARFLVIGGAGSIGSAVVREIFQRNPHTLHIIDCCENSLAELVRDLRSSLGYIEGDFQAYCFDALGDEFEALTANRSPGDYDYVLNFSALKHVRSEKDPFTLMRLVDVNIMLTLRLLEYAHAIEAKKFFCVSTDKAANPVSLMGASKRIMEKLLFGRQVSCTRSTARFANVAFSNGSLPHSWKVRLEKQQPIVAPTDIKRYFVTAEESAWLCLFSILQGNDREIYFPKLDPAAHMLDFQTFAKRFLARHNLIPYPCDSENEARSLVEPLSQTGKWPCYFFQSDTTGEKEFEEFFTADELIDLDRYGEIGIVHSQLTSSDEEYAQFTEAIRCRRQSRKWTKKDLIHDFTLILPDFLHHETGKNLDNRM